MADDIYIGGKQLKQPNPPVKPHWSEDPPDVEPLAGEARMQTDNYSAPKVSPHVAPSTGSPDMRNAAPGDFTGFKGIKKSL